MQPIPGCRIRVWKKEWQQTVGSQTSLTTGTRRIANRNEQRGGGEQGETINGRGDRIKDKGDEKEGGVRKWRREREEAERLMGDSSSQL